MKPLVLTDLITKQQFVLMPGQTKTIGRAKDRDLKTLSGIETDRYNESQIETAKTVSKHHATLYYDKSGVFYIWDDKSRNGTYYCENNQWVRVFQKTQIPHSVELICLGNYQLKIKKEDQIAKESKEDHSRNSKTQEIISPE